MKAAGPDGVETKAARVTGTAARVAQIHQTLSSVNNSRLVFTAPKTKGSATGVGLSTRVVAALRRQRARQDAERAAWGAAYEDAD